MSWRLALRIVVLVLWLYVLFGIAWINGGLQPWIYEALG